MAEDTTDKGREGEEVARRYLEDLGWTTLAMRYRSGRAEVDLIMEEGDFLVFVEVKLRASHRFGAPETFLDALQRSRITQAAMAFRESSGHTGWVRYDIIALTGRQAPYTLDHFRDV